MSIIAIIPARYASTRFPGKPLALVGGMPMIERVWRGVKEADVDQTVVATDDERIEQTVIRFGGSVVMTSPQHLSGTDRCGEAASKLALAPDDIVVNIQGDEPFIRKEEIHLLTRLFNNSRVDIGTLVKPLEKEQDVQNPNIVKIVCSKTFKTLYFSRHAIPFLREEIEKMPPIYYRHIGIYAYRYKILQQIVQLPISPLEASEKLEQLRWLEHDYTIHAAVCHYESIAIDTPEDLERANNAFT